jgi:hypothetical protein
MVQPKLSSSEELASEMANDLLASNRWHPGGKVNHPKQ